MQVFSTIYRRRWMHALLAITLAFFSWYYVSGREKVEIWVPVSVELVNAPEGLIIRSGLNNELEMRIRGPKGLVRTLAEKNISYSVDGKNLKAGQNDITIDPSQLPVSNAFEVVELTPSKLVLHVDKLIEKELPVVPEFKGKLAKYQEMRSIVATPSKMQLKGPETVLNSMKRVKVSVVEDFLNDVPEVWSQEVAATLPDQVESVPAQVRVDLMFGFTRRDIWVKIPLELEVAPGMSVTTNQDFVRLEINGPVPLFLNNKFRKDIHARLRINELFPDGQYDDLQYIVDLPDDVVVVKRNPDVISAKVRHKTN
ncbi:MAG: YbbR-like domain-containing protein [Desulfovibrio sp.]